MVDALLSLPDAVLEVVDADSFAEVVVMMVPEFLALAHGLLAADFPLASADLSVSIVAFHREDGFGGGSGDGCPCGCE